MRLRELTFFSSSFLVRPLSFYRVSFRLLSATAEKVCQFMTEVYIVTVAFVSFRPGKRQTSNNYHMDRELLRLLTVSEGIYDFMEVLAWLKF